MIHTVHTLLTLNTGIGAGIGTGIRTGISGGICGVMAIGMWLFSMIYRAFTGNLQGIYLLTVL